MITKLAIVGSGFGMYCLLPAFHKTIGCKVVSICGKNSSRMRDFCTKFDVTRYDNWKEMLEKEKPDAIAIAVIPKFQFDIIKYSIEHKIAVFAEKPLTTSYDSALELAKLAEKMMLPNMIDFEFPEIPQWRKAKKIIESDNIGKISHVKVNWSFLSYDLKNQIKSWKTETVKGGGVISLVVSHVFYYLENFLGEIECMESVVSSSEKSLNKGETTIKICIKFKNGCKGIVNVDISNSEISQHIIEFDGSNAKLILENKSTRLVDNFELYLLESDNSKKIQVNNEFLNNDESEDPRIKIVKFVAQKFVNWCNTGISQRPNFEDGARVQKLIDMSYSNSKNQ